MKSKLTEQQKINEVLARIFSSLIKKKMNKKTQDLINKNPKLKKSVSDMDKNIKNFNDLFRKEYGDDFADRVERDLEKLY
tara:strand:+ start:904 stop:1143 length:240 start_codon:yes stop_codon:yes gene_type:complete